MNGPRRRIPARIGIAALNILLPGLGLLRAGRRKAATKFLLLVPVMLIAILARYAFGPQLGFGGYAISLLLLLAIYVGAIIVTVVMSWRASEAREPEPQWWSRWYALLGAYFAISVIGFGLVDVMHDYYKPFYLPAESMAPTLLLKDRLVASMQGPGDLRRGDIILFDVGQSIYIKRVAALAGDRIEMRDGFVILNGQPITQRLIGEDRVEATDSGNSALRLAEQFPGEARPHEIYDLGDSAIDDMAEQIVAPGHVFVLGDNRDRSADSRVSRSRNGVYALPVADVRGKALFYTWGPSAKMGLPLTP